MLMVPFHERPSAFFCQTLPLLTRVLPYVINASLISRTKMTEVTVIYIVDYLGKNFFDSARWR